MDRERLAQIPRRTAQQVLTDVPPGPGHYKRLELAVEGAISEEWWRGYWAGRSGIKQSDAEMERGMNAEHARQMAKPFEDRNFE